MSVTSLNTSNGSGLTQNNPTGDIILGSSFNSDNGIQFSAGSGKQINVTMPDANFNTIAINDQTTAGVSITLQSNGTTSNDVYTLPIKYPTVSGQVLSSDDTGTMSWVTGGGGGGNFNNPSTDDLNMDSHAVTNVTNLSLVNSTNAFKSDISCGEQTADTSYVLPLSGGSASQILSIDTIAPTNTYNLKWVTASGTGNFNNPSSDDLDMNTHNILNLNGVVLNQIQVPYPGQVLQVTDEAGTLTWGDLTMFNPSQDDLDMDFHAVINASNFISTAGYAKISELQIFHNGGSKYLNSFSTGAGQGSNYFYTLPATQATDNQYLKTLHDGTMSWDSLATLYSQTFALQVVSGTNLNNLTLPTAINLGIGTFLITGSFTINCAIGVNETLKDSYLRYIVAYGGLSRTFTIPVLFNEVCTISSSIPFSLQVRLASAGTLALSQFHFENITSFTSATDQKDITMETAVFQIA